MCGYQGWFNCEGDGADLGWTHWAKNGNREVGPGNVSVDLWPDLTELTSGERYATVFKHSDGRIAEVYSSASPQVVAMHFRWMKAYGIDGVFLQRFANGIDGGRLQRHKDKVLDLVREESQRHGRVFSVMYDLSGLRSGQVGRVLRDWRALRSERQIDQDPGYLHHHSKPLVAVWGIGFNDNRSYSLADCADLIHDLKEDGNAVMLGVPSWWREGKRDATNDPLLRKVIEDADVICPWSVGRYRTPRQAIDHAAEVWEQDVSWCRDRNLAFMPVVFPGFSWHQLKGGELDLIPRRRGDFLWSQVFGASQAKCQMLYVAMFDEVDEGTAIFKCDPDPPVGEGVKFLSLRETPKDHYLKLVGEAARGLRGEAVIKRQVPVLPVKNSD